MKFIWMFLTAFCAFAFGRGQIRWALAAYVFGPFTLIPLFMLPKKPIKQLSPEVMDHVEGYAAKKEFKDVNTVDDLFKQLETK